VSWKVLFTELAQKDALKITNSRLKSNAEALFEILQSNPFQKPPSYEKLVGDLAGAFSRKINFQHSLVYQILEKEKIVKIIRMWTFYE